MAIADLFTDGDEILFNVLFSILRKLILWLYKKNNIIILRDKI